MITTHGGGTSRKRMHAAKDYSGAEIMQHPARRGSQPRYSGCRLHRRDRAHPRRHTASARARCFMNMETKELHGGAREDRHHRDRRRGQTALSGLPDLQPLRRDRRRTRPRLPSRARSSSTPTPSSTIRPEPLTRPRSSAPSSPKRSARSARSSSTATAKSSCTRSKPATSPPRR